MKRALEIALVALLFFYIGVSFGPIILPVQFKGGVVLPDGFLKIRVSIPYFDNPLFDRYWTVRINDYETLLPYIKKDLENACYKFYFIGKEK